MTRLGHFVAGNALPLDKLARWAVIAQVRLRRFCEDDQSMTIHELTHLVGACSFLLGRRVAVTELFDMDARP